MHVLNGHVSQSNAKATWWELSKIPFDTSVLSNRECQPSKSNKCVNSNITMIRRLNAKILKAKIKYECNENIDIVYCYNIDF